MPAKFERCVRKVRSRSSNVNPYAVCHASMNKKIQKDKFNYTPKTFLPTTESEKVYDKWLKGEKLTEDERNSLADAKKRKVNELHVIEHLKKR